MNFSKEDIEIIKKKKISESQIEEQINAFKTGFPYLSIKSAASINKGILKIEKNGIDKYIQIWDDFLNADKKILKFVPASGAASRMFKDLYAFLDNSNAFPETDFEKDFFENIKKFAFYDDLNAVCEKNYGKNIDELIQKNEYKEIIKNLLSEQGLNYGFLPKALLQFHTYPTEKRTPVQEHLVEAALYAKNKSKSANVHFTVSAEHRQLFENHIDEIKKTYENRYDLTYDLSFSEQKPATDTISVDIDNQPFRENGNIVFRPGGHGALIENLNDLDADLIFIKNIDNLVPDRLKEPTVIYKKTIAGVLVQLQTKTFEYLSVLENKDISVEKLNEIADFCDKQLFITLPKSVYADKNELKSYLTKKLNRPIRVCGMVKNEGEPGGGPYLVENEDKSVSLQILESSQINTNDPAEKEKMMKATHFNPVDLVCAVKNYKGEKFDLTKYVDKNTGFISYKSKGGKELKALELPGLWNGAMSNWNTVFVEVPIETFHPVKTVNDLLRPKHQ